MTTETTTLLYVKPSEIATHHRNPRKTVGDVSDLADSIREKGILQPLVVAPWPDTIKTTDANKRKHLLIAGERRLTAAKMAKLAVIPCVLRSDLDTEGKQVEAMLVENLQRSDLTPVEEGQSYQALLEFPGFTQAKLAKDIGQPVSRIRERLKLAKLDAPVRTKLHEGQIKIADALAIDEFSDDPKATKELLAAAGTDNFKYTLQSNRRTRDERIEREKRLKPFVDAGVPVYAAKTYEDRPKGFKGLGDLLGHLNGNQASVDTRALKHGKDCDGAVVVITQGGLEHGCTQPKNHPKPKVTKTKAQLAAEAKEKAQKKAVRDGAQVSTDLRVQHLREVIAFGPSVPLIRGRLVDLTLEHAGYEESRYRRRRLRFLARLLEVDLATLDGPDVDDQDWFDKTTALLATALGKLDVPGLVVLADVSAHYSCEESLGSDALSTYWGGETESWAKVLEDDYGYSWSPWDKQRFTFLKRAEEAPSAAPVAGDDAKASS